MASGINKYHKDMKIIDKPNDSNMGISSPIDPAVMNRREGRPLSAANNGAQNMHTTPHRGNFSGYGGSGRGHPFSASTHAPHRGSAFDGGGNASRGYSSNGESSGRINYGIGYAAIKDVCQQLDEKKLLLGSGELMRVVSRRCFIYRMNDMWKNIEKDGDFVRVIVAAASTTEMQLRSLTMDFLNRVFETQLIKTMMEVHINQLPYSDAKRTREAAVLLENLLLLFILILQRNPTVADKYTSDILAFQAILSMPEVHQSACSTESVRNALSKLKDQFEARMNEKAKMFQQSTKTTNTINKLPSLNDVPPPENFRQISARPTQMDMFIREEPYLRKNLIKGRYMDSEHYLDVQFRLLREDFLQPLRENILKYSRNGLLNGRKGVHVYTDVYINFPTLDEKSGEVTCRVQFKKYQCSWMKQLIGGSLVCLSPDDFSESLLFATVFERSVIDLSKGFVTLLFFNTNMINHDAEYKMIESSAYFEAYYPVLTGLQAFPEGELVPFNRYLVDVETDVHEPVYLLDCNHELDFEVVHEEDKTTNSEHDQTRTLIDVRRAHEMLPRSHVHVDASQYEAFLMSLRQEFVVIQGPPGTGKTHLGHIIARILLANEKSWNPLKCNPMLIVCYTNHALDQFLQGIIAFFEQERLNSSYGKASRPNLIRIGSRSKCAKMDKYTLSALREEYKDVIGIPWELRWHLADMHGTRVRLSVDLKRESKMARALSESIVPYSYFMKSKYYDDNDSHVIREQHRNAFTTAAQNAYNDSSMYRIDKVFRDWLMYDYGQIQMNVTVIKKLMELGFPELLAKNLSVVSRNDVERAEVWYRHHRNRIHQLTNHPLPEVLNWPLVADVVYLMNELEVTEEDAIGALMARNCNCGSAFRLLAAVTKRDDTGGHQNEQQFDENARIMAELEAEKRHNEYSFDEDDSFELMDRDITREAVRHDDVNMDGNGQWETSKESKNHMEDLIKKYRTRILGTEPCSNREEAAIVDVFQLRQHERWALYRFWATKMSNMVNKRLRNVELKLSELVRRKKEIRQICNYSLLRSARVIGMTTSGAARMQATLKSIQCPIVIVEEAAEAHILTSLTTSCQHCILIGDHKQLRPHTEVYELAKKFNLDVSLFERLINNGFPYAVLNKQHRMRKEIARTLMPHFYPQLEDDPSVLEYPDVKGITKNMMFITHTMPEDPCSEEHHSHKNEYESKYAVYLARYFLQQLYKPEQVTILCAYLEQMVCTRRFAKEILGVKHSVRIEVVDNYQGEESDIVILSLVRSNSPSNTIGFLSVPNRVCVALSRAKIGLYCIANVDFLADKCDLWKNIRDSLEEANAINNTLEVECQNHGTRQVLGTWKDFDILVPEGGCQIPCDTRMDCGHACKRLCHAIQHDIINCMEPCARKCAAGLHPCEKICYEDCGGCKKLVQKELLCGHSVEAECFTPVEDVQCTYPCEKLLICGHKCTETCSKSCTEFCEAVVTRLLACGHHCDMACSKSAEDVKCQVEVTKKWFRCGHEVVVKCCDDPMKMPCPYPCGLPLPDCGHICKGTCGECRRGRLHIRCEERCNRILICGHECGSRCSKVCPPCGKPCETACSHSQCGMGNSSNTAHIRFPHKNGKQKGRTKGRTCGQRCPLCTEQCVNGCEHRQCTLKCFELCNVKPCDEPCSKKLECGHPCIGLCGERCPDVCPICDKEKFNEIKDVFLGYEDEDNARFLQLDGCEHIVEVQGMDKWVASNSASRPNADSQSHSDGYAITQLQCPKCRSAIKRSHRYLSVINQRALDIAAVKEKIAGATKEELVAKRAKVVANVDGLIAAVLAKISEDNHLEPVKALRNDLMILNETLKKVANAVSKIKDEHLTFVCVTKWQNILMIMKDLKDIYDNMLSDGDWRSAKRCASQFDEFFDGKTNYYDVMRKEWAYLVVFIDRMMREISPLMIKQLCSEILRLRYLINISMIAAECARSFLVLDQRGVNILAQLNNLLNGAGNIDDTQQINALIDELKGLLNVEGLGITAQERLKILQAVGSEVTMWYKCSKGHIYGIGDCGRPMQLSKCPECDETIGGEKHCLVSTSVSAAVMHIQH